MKIIGNKFESSVIVGVCLENNETLSKVGEMKLLKNETKQLKFEK